ncbi:MAG: hypothetical protein HEQ29_08970 [Dolichospermum sp. LBC05a]|nr:hypothetical protein [Dolichospermum sp. OL01]MCO5796900.1 hypothetical protein [Dolichospermum sp. OL03]MCS6281059.1 hypothetical protein [Dolichospermum sp.]QSV58473.1 MAG: hypothetical protein HEQ29_08970 [Dolichospermum sp. LBC05a]
MIYKLCLILIIFKNPFANSPVPEKETQFQQDVNELVQTLKNKVTEISNKKDPSSWMGMWIYGSYEEGKLQPENQEMLLFQNYADLLLEKYSHKLTETEPKSISEAYQYIREQGQMNYRKNKKLALELAIWIYDVQQVSVNGTLNNVLEEIDILKNRLSDFKDFQPFKPNFFKSN